jgi:hypothetical protein
MKSGFAIINAPFYLRDKRTMMAMIAQIKPAAAGKV